MRDSKTLFHPRLEFLEERWVPATVKDVAGVLTISNQTGPLVVAPTATPGQVTVTDNGHAVTYSNVGSLISITGTNLADTITFTGNSTGFNGNLLISSGNGNDVVNVTGPVGGNVTVLSGLGNDSLNLGGAIGGSLAYVSTYGNDTVTMGVGAPTTVGGDAGLTGLQRLTLNSAVSVAGNVTLTNLSAGFPLAVTGTGALTVGSSTTKTIGDDATLSVTGGGGSNSFAPTGGIYVGGNADFNFSMSVGTNSLNLSAAGNSGSTIAGNLSFQGGGGNSTVNFPSGVNTFFVYGNATLNTGNGAATLGLAGTGWSVAGNLTINEGNGSNNAFTVAGVVAGNETITQGNGVNGKVTISDAPSGLLTYVGGNGTDSLDLEGTGGSVYDVYLTFGTGTNTLAFDTTNTGITYTGTVIGSGGSNTFTQGSNDTLIEISFINFP